MRQNSAHAPRRAPLFRWSGARWWQYAGGFALAAAIFVWGQSEDAAITSTNALSTPAFTSSSPVLSPTYNYDMLSAYRPSALFTIRRPNYYPTEPSLMPSLAHPSDSLLGYQPVSDWNAIPAQPIMVESLR
ncbi:MAG: hypothetical protein NZM28_09335 [Fimbriimonadales bacterium]|nr:hypothetical protein [Fimbriimonadales bacterium]